VAVAGTTMPRIAVLLIVTTTTRTTATTIWDSACSAAQNKMDVSFEQVIIQLPVSRDE